VIYQDRVIHVAAWAEHFFFSAENLNQRVAAIGASAPRVDRTIDASAATFCC